MHSIGVNANRPKNLEQRLSLPRGQAGKLVKPVLQSANNVSSLCYLYSFRALSVLYLIEFIILLVVIKDYESAFDAA